MENNKYMNPNYGNAPSVDRGLANNGEGKSMDVSINMDANYSQNYLNRSAATQMYGLNAFYALNVQNALENAQGAYIKQKIELLEIFTGCETKNRYDVFLRFAGNEYAYIFKCKEKSGWCERNCLDSNSRPFDLKVKFIKSQADMNNFDYNNHYITFERPYKCTFLCLARPEMTGVYTESGDKFGKIIEPCTLCDPLFLIYSSDEKLKYVISASCCQCGLMCRRFCGKCSETSFQIYSDSKYPDNINPEQADGTIIRKVQGLVQAVFTDSDNFEINFPKDASANDKLMIIGATMMMDYRFFEDTGDSKDLI